MATDGDKLQHKINLIRTLIDHPRTGEAEREAGRRMLQRLLAKAGRGLDLDRRRYGPRYAQVRGMGLPDIAQLMRADIKVARKIGKQAAAPGALATTEPLGTMPAQITVSVTSQYYSGGGAIRMQVRNIPQQWGFVREPDHWGEPRWVPTPALAAVLDALGEIHRSYNYDGSDVMTDYCDVNYLGSVNYDRPSDPA